MSRGAESQQAKCQCEGSGRDLSYPRCNLQHSLASVGITDENDARSDAEP